MSSSTTTRAGVTPGRTALRAGQLGSMTVLFTMLSAAAVLTVVAGVIPVAYASTGLVGLPAAFVLVGLVLWIFLPGYLAMARRLPSAGGMYTFIAAGLGRVPGVGAAWLAVVSYLSVQAAAYGAFGVVGAQILHTWWGLTAPWWTVALGAWVIVAGLGLRTIGLSARVLAVLCVAELAVVVVTAVGNLDAAPHGVRLADVWVSFNPAHLAGPALGAALVLAVLAFSGVEQGVAYMEEARPAAVSRATRLAVVALTVLYAGAAWAMTVPTGPAATIGRAGQLGPDLVATVAREQFGGVVAVAVLLLFATSLFAAMLAFQNTSSRYLFSLGRERVLWARFGQVAPKTGAPVLASAVQSAVMLAVIVTYAIGGWDPITRLFYLSGTAGGFGILVLLAATSIAVVGYFTRRPVDGHPVPSAWVRLVLPAVSGVLLAAGVWLAVTNFAGVLGVAEDSPLAWLVPAGLAAIGAAGCAWGLTLRRAAPGIYRHIGRGAQSDLPLHDSLPRTV